MIDLVFETLSFPYGVEVTKDSEHETVLHDLTWRGPTQYLL